MAATGLTRREASNRAWFTDARGPERRLQVTSHGRTIVLSIWHGDVCVGTAQLPIDDAPRLIAHLADGLSHQFTSSDSPGSPAPGGPSAIQKARRALSIAATRIGRQR